MSPKLSFHPPLLNTASPWATTEAHLRELLLCPSTGAVTTRTSLIDGFPHSSNRHRYAFFDPATGKPSPGTFSGPPEDSNTNVIERKATADAPLATLNTLGYSPLPLSQYLSIISSLASTVPPSASTPPKTIIISVTGSPAEIAACHDLIQTFSSSTSCPFPLAMEVNLSCPNIPNLPPPAYSSSSLTSYLDALPSNTSIPIGIKIPPYTHAGQFDSLIASLLGTTTTAIPASKLSFLTATNTLGSCILLDSLETSGGCQEALPGDGIGGMAGPPLHPLALGNVATLRRRFDQDPRLAHLEIIGVGGVYNGEGYRRMRHVGARAVGIATALGRRGVEVFTTIEDEIKSVW